VTVRAGCFRVRQARGPEWKRRGRREQAGWNERLAFIDELREDGEARSAPAS
jgi:hypothetical protein